MDRNRDRRVDEWTYYEDGKEVWAEFDTDGDSKVNQREIYNVESQVERVEVNRDGDGRMEQCLFYGPGKPLLRAEVDNDGDGQPEQWHTFIEMVPCTWWSTTRMAMELSTALSLTRAQDKSHSSAKISIRPVNHAHV